MTQPISSSTMTREEFLENLQRSGLYSSDGVSELLAASPRSAEATDGESLARWLVLAGKLTAYQADALRDGRFREVVIGNYEILARLGAGGMGTVFKARHRRMKRIVAIKTLSQEVAQQAAFVQRFQREVETLAQLSHPNIVMAYDADEDDVGPFLVMEFVDGRDLASEVEEQGPLSIADAVHCVRQAALGLAFAHAHGMTHRDIKPANLMRDAGGTIKVTDLGLVRLNRTEGKAGASGLTMAGGIVGTVDYMPPEQALDSTTIDHRADIYSLGGTLFFLLAGRPPFQGNSIMALLLQHREAPVPSLPILRPEIPAELEQICHRMLAKKPEERYPSMAEVIRSLDSIQPLVTTLTRRPTPPKSAPRADRPAIDATIAADTKEQLTGNTTIVGPTMADKTPAHSETPAATQLTVVLSEPSRTQAAIVRRYLQEMAIDNVHNTASGNEALSLAKERQAQIVISSMHLKDMTGVQLAEALLADPNCSHVGFLLTTSESESADVEAALQSPRAMVLGKPFDQQKLADTITRLVNRKMEKSVRDK